MKKKNTTRYRQATIDQIFPTSKRTDEVKDKTTTTSRETRLSIPAIAINIMEQYMGYGGQTTTISDLFLV